MNTRQSLIHSAQELLWERGYVGMSPKAIQERLSVSGTPLERIRGYMLRSRQVLKGCQIGKLTQDPEIAADSDLRRPIDETFAWLQLRLSSVLAEGKSRLMTVGTHARL